LNRVTPPVDIIIPVFRGFLETHRCIESVLASSVHTNYELVVVEDCSPDPELVDYLNTLSEHGRITLLQNAENLGFVATVNRGMQLHADRDVLLLNSDTEVANDWLDRLHAAAYSAEEIGTVTPFSNNATICSYPYFNGVGAASLPSGISLAELDTLMAKTTAGQTAEIPTAVGFCMFIKRDCLNEVGYFDEERFGRGYGEENDFSRNAALLGWRNVLAADVFVFHAGGVSFGQEQSALQKAAMAALLDKHPDYLYAIEAFTQVNPLRLYRAEIDSARSLLSPDQALLVRTEQSSEGGNDLSTQFRISGNARLHISHSWGGGIERWIDNFTSADTETNFILQSHTDPEVAGASLTLWIATEGRKSKIALWKLATPIRATDVHHPEYAAILRDLVEKLRLRSVFVSSLIGHALEVFSLQLPTIVILHDMYPFCPAFFAHYAGSECTHCDLNALRTCQQNNPMYYFGNNTRPEWWVAFRAQYATALASPWVQLVAPSRTAWVRWQQLLPAIQDLPCTIIGHGVDVSQEYRQENQVVEQQQRLRLKLVIPGRMFEHKGLNLVAELLPLITNFADVLLLGCGIKCSAFANMAHVEIVPDYLHADLAPEIAAFNPDCAMLLSIVPETFSYTLSEMQALGVPVVATNLGAHKERIQTGITGWLVEPDVASVVQFLRWLDENRTQISAVAQYWREHKPVTIHAMRQQYLSILPTVTSSPQRISLLDGVAQLAQQLQQDILALEESSQRSLEEVHHALQTSIHQAEQAAAEHNEQILRLNQAVTERDNRIASILNSRSWKLTRPFRATNKEIKSLYQTMRPATAKVARKIWNALPISYSQKTKAKNWLFENFSAIFRSTHTYKIWKAGQGHVPHQVREVNQDDIWGYTPITQDEPLASTPVKVICLYLPQFHPIPENDIWRETGFTEWSDVQSARPIFTGHCQPHIPGELGYYNLLNPAIQHRQIELAKLYGIHGFCFYFYWFGGKRLFDTPIENYLVDPSLDLPFSLCWANENWSPRGDGNDSEILIAQQYAPEDDLAFIKHVARFMRDARYIRVEGKPLLIVNRPALLPNAQETAARWRAWCLDHGVGEIYLAYTQSFETEPPSSYGFDGAIELPPNLSSAQPDLSDSVEPVCDDFSAKIYDWRKLVQRSEHYQDADYELFRSISPAWDNTARQGGHGTVFINSTPELYQHWLERAIRYTEDTQPTPDKRMVFVNAWNRWEEGAYLEPDARYGYAYLQATRNALANQPAGGPSEQRKIILVTHDAHPHGAQLLALYLARTLNEGMGFKVDMVCLGDGPLKAQFTEWAYLHELGGHDPRGSKAEALAKHLYDEGHRHAVVNTTVSGHFLETLTRNGIKCIALIHELRGVLDQFKLHDQARTIVRHAHKIIFPANEVASSFLEVAPSESDKILIRPQGLYKRRRVPIDRNEQRRELRQLLGLSSDCKIILGVGYADHRKGVDLFVEAGLLLAERHPEARWVWVGHWEPSMQLLVEKKIGANPSLKDRFIFPGLKSEMGLFYDGADIFALTSREDPFPSVVLEAMDARLPVVGFDEAGGFTSLLTQGCGMLAAKNDATALAEVVGTLLSQPDLCKSMGNTGWEITESRFSFRHYVFDLLDQLGIGLDRISVILPNYNYEKYLTERLESIFNQNYPIFEIIFLDDRSKDNSLQIAHDLLSNQSIDYRIVLNEENSGSVFKQWKKGVELARGDKIWIAEADDSCGESLLSETRKGFRTPGVVLSYCESRQIDENGQILADNYLAYVADIDNRHWLTAFVMDGDKEAAQSFSIKNVIPNVSAVLFEIAPLRLILEENMNRILRYRVAGDWLIYVLLLQKGRIAFSPLPENRHRRHQNSVTIGSFNEEQWKEIRDMQITVASMFHAPADKRAVADKYANELAVQFGLAQSNFSCSVGE
jgi:O-antigen biosynthesis protein